MRSIQKSKFPFAKLETVVVVAFPTVDLLGVGSAAGPIIDAVPGNIRLGIRIPLQRDTARFGLGRQSKEEDDAADEMLLPIYTKQYRYNQNLW